MTKITDEGLLDGSGDPAWNKLLDDNAVSVKIEESPKDSSTSSDMPAPGMPVRKESIFNSFHRQLRMSLKAVSESPGPISRYSRSVICTSNYLPYPSLPLVETEKAIALKWEESLWITHLNLTANTSRVYYWQLDNLLTVCWYREESNKNTETVIHINEWMTHNGSLVLRCNVGGREQHDASSSYDKFLRPFYLHF